MGPVVAAPPNYLIPCKSQEAWPGQRIQPGVWRCLASALDGRRDEWGGNRRVSAGLRRWAPHGCSVGVADTPAVQGSTNILWVESQVPGAHMPENRHLSPLVKFIPKGFTLLVLFCEELFAYCPVQILYGNANNLFIYLEGSVREIEREREIFHLLFLHSPDSHKSLAQPGAWSCSKAFHEAARGRLPCSPTCIC